MEWENRKRFRLVDRSLRRSLPSSLRAIAFGGALIVFSLAGQSRAQGSLEPIPTFEDEQAFIVFGMHPLGLAAADVVDAGGCPEIAVCGSAYDINHLYDRRDPGENGGWVEVFRNLGVTNGTWNGLSTLATIIPADDLGTDTAPREVALVEMTGDEVLDLVVATAAPVPESFTETWGVLVYRRTGSGYELHSARMYTGGDPAVLPARGLVVADFNNDGHNDVALAVDSEETSYPPRLDRVAIFENTFSNGDWGHLQLATEFAVNLPTFDSTASIVAGNFNRLEVGQPLIDMVAGNIGDEHVSLLTNGSGFNFVVNNQSSACNAWLFCDMAAGKFTAGSANWDVAGVSESGDCNLYVLHGSHNGTFSHDCVTDTYELLQGCVQGPAYRAVAAGMLNGGTRPDLVVTDPTNPGAVMWLLGRGDGTFQYQRTGAYSDGIGGWMPMQVLCADLDQDGFDDIITSNHQVFDPDEDPFTISVLINNMGLAP